MPDLVPSRDILKIVEATYGSGSDGGRRMDVDLTIRYSDDRLCEVVVCRPNDETPLYRIATRRTHLG
jgi:hypothetical protein